MAKFPRVIGEWESYRVVASNSRDLRLERREADAMGTPSWSFCAAFALPDRVSAQTRNCYPEIVMGCLLLGPVKA